MSDLLKRGGLIILAALLMTSGLANAMVVTPITPSEGLQFLAEAIAFATVEYEVGNEKRVGVPYQWGGRTDLAQFVTEAQNSDVTHLGVDASGLVIAASRVLSPSLHFRVRQGEQMVTVSNINSSLLFQWNVVSIDFAELQPGDLIFFSGASGNIEGVGIYERTVGRHVRFVVASANSGRVVQTSLNLDGDYWATRFAGAGRLIRSEAQ